MWNDANFSRLLMAVKGDMENPVVIENVDLVRQRVARDLQELVAKHLLQGPDYRGFLSERHNNNNNKGGVVLSTDRKINLLSRVMEAKLYKGSTSLEAHADPATLEGRFKAVLSRLKSHRPSVLSFKEALPNESTSTETRKTTQKDYQRLLRAHVGESVYEQIQSARRDLHFLRQTSKICFDAMKDRVNATDGTERACAADMVPNALCQLYFNNRLLNTLGSLNVVTNSVEMKRVTKPNWTQLLHEAQGIIANVWQLNESLKEAAKSSVSRR